LEIGTSGEREVQRTFMQLLSELDGFDNLGEVKVIGCTNRKDILDSAIIRPGRLERHIHIPVPSADARKEIFKIHTKRMNTTVLDVDKLHAMMEEFTGADIRATCTEAGYFAIRTGRVRITNNDFYDAIEKVKKKEGNEEHLAMFG